MRIGIDGHVLGKNIGGVERFVRELVNQLPVVSPENEYIVFVTKAEYRKINSTQMLASSRVSYVPVAISNPLIQRLALLPWMVFRYRLDALLVQRLSPWLCGRCKLLVTIHDLTPIKFASAYKGLSNYLVRLLTKNTIQRADLILTPTEAIKAEILAYCPTAKSPIKAFYNGVDVAAFSLASSSQKSAQSKYILTVGAIEKRKNVETLLKAMAVLQSSSDIRLKIVGKVRDQAYYSSLIKQVNDLGIANRVDWIGFTQEDELIRLYQQASIFVTASLDEGFNIPPLEAMACGVPVLCSNIPVHCELFEGAVLFFEPQSTEDLLQKVQYVLTHEAVANDLVAQGQKKVAQFTWQRTAQNVAHAIREVG